MGLFARWRSERALQEPAARYAAALAAEPDSALATWLAGAVTGGDEDHARWELRYARRALGLLAAERDALDDRTPSLVAAALGDAFRRDPSIARDRAALAERQFNQRLAGYREAARERESRAPLAIRYARVLLRFAAGGATWEPVAEERLAHAVADFLASANVELRRHFGQASLPDDLPPSALRR